MAARPVQCNYPLRQVDRLHESCKIRFVDYGTEGWSPVEMMRKDLFTVEFNIQSFALQMDDIRPSGDKWEVEELELLHEKLVDQTFHVDIEEFKVEFVKYMQITLL